MDTSNADIDGRKKSYPPLDELIGKIDRQIEGRPHPYATGGFEAFLGSQLGNFKRRGKQYLCFHLQETQFAVPMEHTREITYRTDITPLPNVPGWVLGISNVRGDIVSIVNLSQVLGVAGPAAALGHHLILIRDAEMTVGILADNIAGTIFDEDPNHQIKKRVPEGEALSRFIGSIFVDGSQEIYLLKVPKLMAALAIN